MAGYSGTPLVNKLGIKTGHRVAFISAPKNYAGNSSVRSIESRQMRWLC